MSNIISFNVNNIISSAGKDAKSVSATVQDSPKTDDIHHDLSFIQCFWGTDLERISAAVICIKSNLKILAGRITDWTFVEAQTSKSDACFSWVKRYGIKYRFVKIPKESDYLFIKMPLWNIGVQMAGSENLCFIDSDVTFENGNILGPIDDAFLKYDVIQLHSSCKDADGNPAVNSLAYEIMKNPTGFKTGHGGNTLGMKRKAYDEIGGFAAVNYLDDQWFWLNIVGTEPGYEKFFKLPYKPDTDLPGYPFKIGAAGNAIRHIGHGGICGKYDLAHSFSYGHCRPFEDIAYDDKSKLPVWSDTATGRIMKKCFGDLFKGVAGGDTYMRHCIEEYGRIDPAHPLIIVSSYLKPTYRFKTDKCVIEQYEQLKETVKNDFHYICVTNEKIESVDTIPYNSRPEKLLDFVFGKKIRYPKDSTVVYIGMNEKPDILEFYRMIGKRNVILNGRLVSDGIER